MIVFRFDSAKSLDIRRDRATNSRSSLLTHRSGARVVFASKVKASKQKSDALALDKFRAYLEAYACLLLRHAVICILNFHRTIFKVY